MPSPKNSTQGQVSSDSRLSNSLPPPSAGPSSSASHQLLPTSSRHSVTTSTPALPHPSPQHKPVRPSPPSRSLSYQKRHASFDSPCEIPLPSPSLLVSYSPFHFPASLSNGKLTSDAAMPISNLIRTATSLSNNVMAADSARSSSTASSSSNQSAGSFPVFDDEDGSDALTSPEPSPVRNEAECDLAESHSTAKIASVGVRHRSSQSGDFGAGAARSGGNDLLKPSSNQNKGKGRAPLESTPVMTASATPTSSLIFPFSRPYSLPPDPTHPRTEALDSPSKGDATSKVQEDGEPTPVRDDEASSSRVATWIDRSSSASLPLPAQIPFHVLPRAAPGPQENQVWGGPQLDDRQSPHALYGSASVEQQHDSTYSSDSGSLPSAPASPPISPQLQSQTQPQSQSSNPAKAPSIPRLGPLPSAAAHLSQNQPQPSPPLTPGSMAIASAIAEMRRVPGGLAASRAEFGIGYFGYQAGAPSTLGRAWSESPSTSSGVSASTSLLQQRQSSQPEPSEPQQQHPSSISAVLAQQQRLAQMATGQTSSSSYPRGSSNAAASSPGLAYAGASRISNGLPPSTYPPPEPPIILPEDPDDAGSTSSQGEGLIGGLSSPRSAGGLGSAQQPPYAPFLCRAPPPADSWIEVETTAGEYRLNVRLPGFQRDSITLATKRRRILHVVADSWEQNGGHFERRISFGYDADLTQVRAEFDGLMLKVSIPRRIPPISWIGNRR